MIQCKTCKVEKEEKDFRLRFPDTGTPSRDTTCKDCENKSNRDSKIYSSYYMKKSYNEMYAEQKGICPGCQEFFDNLQVDHCHDTEVVRNLLCGVCNTLLGLMEKYPWLVEPLKAYSMEWKGKITEADKLEAQWYVASRKIR